MENKLSNQKIISEINKLERYHDSIRNLLPYIPKDFQGKKSITGEVSKTKASLVFVYNFFDELSLEAIQELNDKAHHLNQNVLIRLFSILQEFDILSYGKPINEDIPGSKKVKILKKLRNVLAHESGRFIKTDAEHREAVDLMIEELGISFDKDNATEFDLSKDTVIKPLFQGAREYIINYV